VKNPLEGYGRLTFIMLNGDAVALSPAKNISTLRQWRRKKYFPEPKHHNRSLWFTENQMLLLKSLKEFFRVYGKRTGKIKLDRLKEWVASIAADWD
jgi:hypothetical protein